MAGSIDSVFDTGLLADVAQLHTLAAKIAAHITPDTTGTLAVECLPEMFAAVRQGELACVRLIERADRTGENATGGAASISAYVRAITPNETERCPRRDAEQSLAGWQPPPDNGLVSSRGTQN